MLVFRSLIFYIFWFFFTILLGAVSLILIIFFNQKIIAIISFIWSNITIKALCLICNIQIEVRDKVNIPKNKAIMLASRHESTFETLFYRCYFKNPCFILKRELLFIPVFGIYLFLSKMIVIKRTAGITALKSMVKQAKSIFAAQRTLVLFPEGTRVAPKQKVKLFSGIKFLINNYPQIPVYTAALNTGKCWTKKSFIIHPGKIIIEFDKIDDKKNVMEELATKVVTKSIDLY